jgi:hypothetical protein
MMTFIIELKIKLEQQRYRTRKRGKAIPAAVAENV